MALSAVIGSLRVNLSANAAEFLNGLKGAEAGLKKTGARMQSIGQAMSIAVTAPLSAFGALTLRTAGNFEASMNRVQAALGASGDEMGQLGKLAQDMGRDTKFSASEAADAIEILAKNGLNAAQIMGGALDASLKLAAASGAELASAGDLATDVMLNFGKEAGDLGGVIDGVTGVLLQSKFGFDDYRLALAQAGGVAGGLGVSLQDFNAVITATSSAFASGSDAGTSFKTFLQRLVPSSDGAAAAMEQLGLEFFTADGAMKSMAEIAQELKEGLAGLSDEARNDALSTIFGTDALRTAIGLAREGAEGIRELDAAIGEASASEQAAARMKGFNGAMERLGSSIEALQHAIAESGLLDFVTELVERLTGVVASISESDPKLLRLGTIFAALAAAIGPALVALGLAATAVAAIGAPVALVIAGITALTAAVVAFWPEIKAMAAAIRDGAIAAFDALIETVDRAIAAFLALPEKMMQIGEQIVQGLIDGVKAKAQATKDAVLGVVDGVVGSVKGALGIQSPSRVFREIGQNIVQGLAGGISETGAMVEGPLNSIIDRFGTFADNIISGTMSVKDAIKSMLVDLAKIGLNALTPHITSALTGAFGGGGAMLPATGLGMYASGTMSAARGMALVGERGPELVRFNGGERVFNARDTSRMMGGGGGSSFNISVDARGSNDPAAVEAAAMRGTQMAIQSIRPVVMDMQRRGEI